MSTSPTIIDSPSLQTTNSQEFAFTFESLKYAVTHVFLPVELPEKSNYTPENDHSLTRGVCAAVHAYSAYLSGFSEQAQWNRISKMLDNLQASVQSEHIDYDCVISQLRGMQTGDVLVFLIRHQNAAVVLTKQASMLCEVFEVSPNEETVLESEVSLIYSYPGSAVEMPNEVFDYGDFQSELAKFLSYPTAVNSDPPLPPPTHPECANVLFSSVLQSIRDTACSGIMDSLRTLDVPRITKHVRDEVGNSSGQDVWRRSSLWLLIRVAIQMSTDRCPPGRASYKRFMLFFVCILARDRGNTSLSSDLLHLMSSTVFRRLRKLGPSTPDWLSEMAINTCTCLQEILDDRWKELSNRPFLFRNPSQDELTRDGLLSLPNSCEYIRDALENPVFESVRTPFCPSHNRRGTLQDFLSLDGTLFDEAHAADPDVTLYDIEQAVEQGIDEWLASVTNVDAACAQLEILMDRYTTKALVWAGAPEDASNKFLVELELYVALDKLVVKEVPMLADYRPEVPIAFLERLLLRNTTSLHRLSCAYQYLSVRHSQSRPGWSVLSNEFTEDSFPVRYYNQSLHLQQLKGRIEEDTFQREISEVLPLPAMPLHAIVVVFELQCPEYIRIWRSAAARILLSFYRHVFNQFSPENECHLLARVPVLQPYLLQSQGPPVRVQIHLAYFYPEGPQSRNIPILRYAVQHPDDRKDKFSVWPPNVSYELEDRQLLFHFRYQVEPGTVPGEFEGEAQRYVDSTSHTLNDVLAAQVDCPTDLSLDEFIVFAHLRSGGSLQWPNILRGLRSRTLNFRRHQVHYLLSQTAFQVGPLDLNTGTWIWHQELQDLSFCSVLLDELENLFVAVGASSIDTVLMNTISLLLTRVLASSPSQDISERAIALLRSVRRKTFSWMQELLYDLVKASTNYGRRKLFVDVAATCRSTFDVDPAILYKLFHSAEDIDALLSCAYFLHAFYVSDGYLNLLRGRDYHLSLTIEGILKDVILADPSDYGVDLAVGKIFTHYKPGTQRWDQLRYPNPRWLTSQTKATINQPSQTVHVNLLRGALRVDGRPLGRSSHEIIGNNPELRRIFYSEHPFVTPSDLPGMDFMTLVDMTSESKRKLHFSLRDDKMVIRTRGNKGNEILQLIPSQKLWEDLPPALVHGHVHWLNLSTKIIEIRPLKRLLEESLENWRISCVSGQYRMYRGCETLLDIHSPTWAVVSKCFYHLNNVKNSNRCMSKENKHLHARRSTNVLITTTPIDGVQSASVLRLSVTLPQYGLSFFVNDRSQLESHDFRGMVCDENQCAGTLFGLENLLVLRPRGYVAETLIPESLVHRRVIVPNGELTKYGNHQVRVDLEQNYNGSEGPLFHTYNVDTELGCLMGNGDLKSTKYLIELHAKTSCYRPDPLTGKTGAQTALCLLQSGVCRSILGYRHEALGRVSTPFPQIQAAYMEITHRCYWDRHKHKPVSVREMRAARRAAYLFPSNATGPTFETEDHNYNRDVDHLGTENSLEVPFPSLPQTWFLTHVTLDRLICTRPAPEELPARITLRRDSHTTSSDDMTALDQLFSSPTLRTDLPFQREYLTHLDASAQSVRAESRVTHRVAGHDPIEALKIHYVRCRSNFMECLVIMKETLSPTTDSREEILERFGQWPTTTANALLRYLASTSPIRIPSDWTKCLTSLALHLLELQRARRLLQLTLNGLEKEVLKELANDVCDGWDPERYPDWLLIQIQGNFLIRRTQAETAMEIMSPRSGENTVMQVNMGEGKSSVIIPIAAAALADGNQLVRVVVPKALTVQMFESLLSRLGGLANRAIYHLPFSRTPDHDLQGRVITLQVDDLRKLMSQCMVERGIVLVQPDHAVSLKLMGIEEQLQRGWQAHQVTIDKIALIPKSIPGDSYVGGMFQLLRRLPSRFIKNDDTPYPYGHEHRHGISDTASNWLSLHKWIDSHTRDILDECDEILHVRFQLVYTIDAEQHMDGYPERWVITQQILRLVKKHVYSLSRYAPDCIELEHGPPGSFPHVQFTQVSEVGPRLISLIKEDVVDGQLPSLNLERIFPRLKSAIRSFISDEAVLQIPDTVKMVEDYAKGSNQSHLWGGLLLIRGLLTSNILLYALAERRWRVDYGFVELARTFTMLAVPYRAKDVPASSAQFGHPDLTIILTCLSYYYTGLTEEQLRTSFEILLDQDDPASEYAFWIKEFDGNVVPESLQKLRGFNLRSSEQWDNLIFPLFSRNQATIDFYLSQVVFPKETKEFPWKLCGSSWDLAEKREKLITGFSGTNDGRWLLPTSIAQCDLAHQKGTNARVLAYLLRPENAFYMVTHDNSDEGWSTSAFLRTIVARKPEIRVLLDVGSQILDLSNRQVATAWLDICHDAAGAIYFSEADELMILGRNGMSLSLLSSPLSQQLNRCVVYLDHAHTRGTDIKLPTGSRAAVTLGPKVTKDVLLQGCMRMRKLGHGHSVMFFAPPKVDRSIRKLTAKTDLNTPITTTDLLCWVINETWNDIQQRAPYWAQQGMNHKARYEAWSHFCKNEITPEQLSDVWLQPDSKSLVDLYAPCETKNTSSILSALDPEIRQRCKDLGVLILPSAQMDEEQEREIQQERERERDIELPPKAEPAVHHLHPDVVSFIRSGSIPPLHSGSAFIPVFTTLARSSAATRDADVWSPSILATKDFCITIKPESTRGTIDKYLRSVQWILSRKSTATCHQVLVFLSPFEVEQLMPDIRASEYVHLHLYAPRTTQRMKPSDDLRLYSIPPLPSNWTPPWDLIDQLNVFAGQLYLRDYASYIRLCGFLGIPTKKSSDDTTIQRNLFNIPGGFEEMEITFSDSPLPAVVALLAIRTRGRPFAHTHMGKILQGQPLTEEDFKIPLDVTSGTIPSES